jgi:hypothetical protein
MPYLKQDATRLQTDLQTLIAQQAPSTRNSRHSNKP